MNIIQRKNTLRLPGYDYSQPGHYFVTMCTRQREYVFGKVVDGQMQKNDIGNIVLQAWEWLCHQYQYVELDEMVIMPNHLHGILMINCCRGGSRTAPTEKRKTIGRLIGVFKTISTKHINEIRNTPGIPVWQRNFYEHIIRIDRELDEIRRYIAENPIKWEMDENFITNN